MVNLCANVLPDLPVIKQLAEIALPRGRDCVVISRLRQKRKTQPQGKACWVIVARAPIKLSDWHANVLDSDLGNGCRSGCVLMTDDLIGLGALLSLNNVKFYFVAFF